MDFRANVLIVDNDPVTQLLLATVLGRAGTKCCGAMSGADALALTDRAAIDLAIVDLALPDMQGLELVAQLSSKPHLRSLPFIICTGTADRTTVQQAAQLGVREFVKKPIVAPDFMHRVGHALRAAPPRWEPWSLALQRLDADRHAYRALLELGREQLATSVAALGVVVAGGGDAVEFAAAMSRMRGVAADLGALRTVGLIDGLWTTSATAEALAPLHVAMTVELSAFDHALACLSPDSAALAAATPPLGSPGPATAR
jgi:CheY-like chemotaxis protein